MKLCFLLVRRVPPVPSPVLSDAFTILTRQRFTIHTGIAEEMLLRPDQLRVEHDLYLLKSHTELSLSLAGILHDQGARLLNPYPSCATTQNKIIVSRRLRAAHVPVPDAWVTGDLSLLEPIVAQKPIIIKPYMGHRGAGIHIVNNLQELTQLPAPEHPVLIQEYIPGGQEDLKVYVVGERVFAVRKPFSLMSFAQPGRACPVSEEVRGIALRCGKALGLGLYGLDMVEGPGGPMVVDVNYFPGYKGVPDAGTLIAGYIEAYAYGSCQLTLPPFHELAQWKGDFVAIPTSPQGLTTTFYHNSHPGR